MKELWEGLQTLKEIFPQEDQQSQLAWTSLGDKATKQRAYMGLTKRDTQGGPTPTS